MSISEDIIQFDDSSDWRRVVGTTLSAQRLYLDTYAPIGQTDLNVLLSSSHIVVYVRPPDAKVTWRYGGEIRQAWDFPSGGDTGILNTKAQSIPTQLFIGKPQLMNLSRSETNNFRLLYDPPTWFKSVVVIVWEYIGETRNFTRDTLFEIGNKLGIATGIDPNNLPNLIQAQNELLVSIENRLIFLEDSISNLSNNSSTESVVSGSESNNVIDDVIQVKNQLDVLTEAVTKIIPESERDNLSNQSNTRDAAENEFL